jgi:hypothetical protein
MKFVVYITAAAPTSVAYFMNSSLQPPCVYVYPLIVAMQRLGKHVPAAKCTRNNGRSAECVVVYKVHAISKDSVGLCITMSLLGFMSVNIVP